MKSTGILICILCIVSCSSHKGYQIKNSSDRDIQGLTFVLSRTEVNHYLKDTTHVKSVIVRKSDGEILVSQRDDLDGDGKWDELAFQCNLKSGEKQRVYFSSSDSMPFFEVRTNVRFGRIAKPFEEIRDTLRIKDTEITTPAFQMEGPAWENEWIAFRNYYDARNGIDIFGKTSSGLVLDSVGVNGRTYHTLSSWGMDILKVGNSLGAGAIALKIGDSLYRIGPCDEGHYRLIAEGPVRLMFELTYKNVPAGQRFYDVVHRISMGAGDRYYKSQVWVDKLQGDESLVTGIVNLHNIPVDTFCQDNIKIIYSMGNQAISGELLGMALLVPQEFYESIREAPLSGSQIVNTHLVSLRMKRKQPVEFAFCASWQNRDPDIQKADFFKKMLTEASGKIIQTSLKKEK